MYESDLYFAIDPIARSLAIATRTDPLADCLLPVRELFPTSNARSASSPLMMQCSCLASMSWTARP